MKQLYLLLILFILTSTQGQTSQNDSIYFWKSGLLLKKRSVKTADLDSITFKINYIKICELVWAKKNLDVSTYSDGTNIPQVTDATAWNNLTTGAWCYYGNNQANNAVYGKLYNWYAVAGIYDAASLANPALRKKLAPTGWHVPADTEWTYLISCIGGANVAGGKMKETGTTYWSSPNTAATNSTGFTGLPGGHRYGNTFTQIGSQGYWWSLSDANQSNAYVQQIGYFNAFILSFLDSKQRGQSVRCIRD
ncbi:MAG: fibrobacter succinogenes major paralogous domain-containing protein [Flavobacterium sp.]|nr:fibrobacter succinogenes major paralogous domain-containing protein [Flavobacterium sp.]